MWLRLLLTGVPFVELPLMMAWAVRFALPSHHHLQATVRSALPYMLMATPFIYIWALQWIFPRATCEVGGEVCAESAISSHLYNKLFNPADLGKSPKCTQNTRVQGLGLEGARLRVQMGLQRGDHATQNPKAATPMHRGDQPEVVWPPPVVMLRAPK